MLGLAIASRIGSSSRQIDIEDIIDGCLKLSGNRYRQILVTGSLNFELKSEDEQDALIDSYEGFLNSIGFPLQILIRTREIDMDDYLDGISVRIDNEETLVYKKQLKSYSQFISSLIASNKILSRQFYIVVPFDSPKSLPIKSARDQLSLRADIIAKNLSRLGIACKQLSSIEVVDLFYSFYSPLQFKNQPLSEKALAIMNREFIVGAKSND